MGRALLYLVAGLLFSTDLMAGGRFVLPDARLESAITVSEGDSVLVRHAENARWVSSGLAVLLGPFGAHRLYLGTSPKVAIIYGITLGGFGILALLDLGHLLFSKDLEAYRNNDKIFMWSGRKEREPTPP